MSEQRTTFKSYFDRTGEVELTRRATKRTKVLATLGPATDDPDVLRKMLHAGMSAARFNMSHGTHEEQQKRLDTVHELSRMLERPVAIVADLQGPKIRTGPIGDPDGVTLEPGRPFTITAEDLPEGDAERVGTTYPRLPEDIREGGTILLDDGRLKLRVVEVDGTEIRCTVLIGGRLRSNKGINLPGVHVSAPSLSDKDKEDLAWALENDVDYVALSFVRSAVDVRHLKRRIRESGREVPIIAKIEKREAVESMEEIIAESDGIMVARGDLGIEIGVERLPTVQKRLIQRANANGKLVITATQMLESMIEREMPTRAEASDVANAVFDGTDAVMLSGETAVGNYPLQAIEVMSRIAVEAESSPYMPGSQLAEGDDTLGIYNLALTGSVTYLANRLGSDAMILFCNNPAKPRMMSKRRYPEPNIVICHDEATWRYMSLWWGTVPLVIPAVDDPQDLLERGIDEAIRAGVLRTGNTVVVLQAVTPGAGGTVKVVGV